MVALELPAAFLPIADEGVVQQTKRSTKLKKEEQSSKGEKPPTANATLMWTEMDRHWS